MTKFKDTDYLMATMLIRSRENYSLTYRDLVKMIESRSGEEAYKVLTDAGIGVGLEYRDYEKGLEKSLSELYSLMQQLTKETDLAELFRLKYDGHNVKTLIKAKKTDDDFSSILSGLGNVHPKSLAAELESGKFEQLNAHIAAAAVEAEQVLAKTSDPAAVDIIIDKAVLQAMSAKVKDYENSFIRNIIQADVDIANIRAAVRVKRMGKDVFYLRKILFEGGKLDTTKLADAFTRGWEDLASLISSSEYGKTLAGVIDSVNQGSLSAFEKACDNYIINLLKTAKLIPFGIEPIVAYLYARENEIRCARIVMASKLAGVSSHQITERLRDTYAQ